MIEDAAASLGSRANGRLTGTFGDAAFFSFDSTKLVNVPLKGGFLTVVDESIFERTRSAHARLTHPMSRYKQAVTHLSAVLLVALEHHALYRVFHTLFFAIRRRFTEDAH